MGQDYTYIGPAGAQGNIAPSPNATDTQVQLAIQSLAGGPVAPFSAYARAFAQVTGFPEPTCRQVFPYSPCTNVDQPIEFVAFWQGAGARWVAEYGYGQTVAELKPGPLPAGTMTAAQYAALFPQNVGVPIDLAEVAKAQAAEAAASSAGNASASATPEGDAAAGGAGAGFDLAGLLKGSIAFGIPNWLLLAGGAGALFLFGGHQR